MKKRIAASILAIIMIMSLMTSCKSPWDSETEPATEETEIITEPETEPDPTEDPGYNPLTGLTNLPDGTNQKRPVAIVISNIQAARPQWGLSTPDICFEGLTEGGITRMLGFYADYTSIPKVGPIRSARHDFAELTQGFDAIYVHAGESVYATEHFREYDMDDIDGNWYDGTFFKRDSERRRSRGLEHSMYIDAEELLNVMEYEETRTELNQAYKNVLTFARVDDLTVPATGACDQIDFSYSNTFDNSMLYDPVTHRYTKYQEGDVAVDANNDNEVTYVNVLLLFTDVSSMGDSAGRIDMDLSGGNGIYVSRGRYENITWEKGDPTATLKLYRADGTVLPLNPGNSYIGLVPTSREDRVEITSADPETSSEAGTAQ